MAAACPRDPHRPARRGPARPTGRAFVVVPLTHPARNRLPRDFITG